MIFTIHFGGIPIFGNIQIFGAQTREHKFFESPLIFGCPAGTEQMDYNIYIKRS